MKIKVTPEYVRFIYSDKIPLAPFGNAEVVRASNVEYEHGKQGWTVQLADGMYLASDVIKDETYITGNINLAKTWLLRDDALKAEVEWLNARL
jgi:hypothetical protein